MTRRHKIEALRQRAVVLRHNASLEMMEAAKLDDEADRMEEQEEAQEAANAELVGLWFRYSAQLRRAH